MIALPYSSAQVRTPWSWRRYSVVVVFGGITAHYALPFVLWLGNLRIAVRDASGAVPSDCYLLVLAPLAQCALLLSTAVVALVEAVRTFRRWLAWLVILLAASAANFAVDVAFERYQFSICMATKEYWDAGGPSHIYTTWWWYNDRWFHGRCGSAQAAVAHAQFAASASFATQP